MMEKKTLWTKNYTTIMVATALGALGNVALSFALSFIVFDETGSTLKASVLFAAQTIPGLIVPLLVSPVLDRYPRKPFLVFFDGLFAVMYLIAGIWMYLSKFNYMEYLLASLVFQAVGELDGLSFNALFPKLIPEGFEEKGYTVSSLLYPTISVIMTPLVSIVYKKVGLASILFFQAVCSLLACVIESTVQVEESVVEGTELSVRQWWGDIKDVIKYLKEETGILTQAVYSSYSNGTVTGFSALQVAFYSTAAGFSPQLYAILESVSFFARTAGGLLLVKRETPKEKKYSLTARIYLINDILTAIQLYLPFPLQLIDRAAVDFFGVQSSNIRYAAFSNYMPDRMRARLFAFDSVFFLILNSILTLAIGALGEVLPYRLVMLIFGGSCIAVWSFCILGNRKHIEPIYLKDSAPAKTE
ncbi:MAG: MFS transporter [Oscillospiraceae bacterium]|nr:MFS transporter [Oscillospiraceae bacterium]